MTVWWKRLTAAVTVTVAATAGLTGPAGAASASNILYGVFPGYTSPASIAGWLGKTPAVQVNFHSFNPDDLNAARSDLTGAWNNGSVPLLTWELYLNSNTHTSTSSIDVSITQGKYDGYIAQYADMLHTWAAGADGRYGTSDDRKLYLRFGHEMNGNWYPWSRSDRQSPADYAAAWRRVHDAFTTHGLDSAHVQWMWIPMSCVSINGCGGGNAADYYPGSSYVDWAGVDAYNWGTAHSSGWQQPGTILDQALRQVAAIAPGKPLAIPETGSSSSGGDKVQWMRDLGGFTSYFTAPGGERVKMLDYFNIDKETDWAVLGGSGGDSTYQGMKTYSTFRGFIGSSNYVGASGHLTDAQFRGQL
ncbi:glycosyl hydrolase [Amycolatopsis sp. PS_44_ISF1]|uniref:glycoside hydrolase family 26 protein n=1 Tax=Amycolatopsis sp. PS_44_ISF1 TaxID=2974917 RepID=UPI0028DF0718|nr:glycosyl hydrolase [Amycolatopsis sp. PS_44_ISF1]MDT8912374.1 glycosyl hydrolase [Amycolatopsis sp. PS_44_ISF1]